MNGDQSYIVCGIDVGTSSIKAVALEIEGNAYQLLWSAARPYNGDFSPERDVAKWYEQMDGILGDLLSLYLPCAIGFTGQMHTLYAETAGARLDLPALLWLDMHGSRYLPDLGISDDEFIQHTANLPLPDFTLAKWLYVKNAYPEASSQIERLLCAKDIARHYLDPQAAFVLDRNEATGTQCFNPFTDQWASKILHAAGIPRRILPKISDSRAIAGYLKHKGHSIPLILGTGDQAAAVRALGADREGIISASLGSSGVLSFPLRQEKIAEDWAGDFHLFPLGYKSGGYKSGGYKSGHETMYQAIGTVPALGSSLHWARNIFQIPSAGEFGKLAHAAQSRDAELMFMPYLGGMGAPNPNHALRGGLMGLSLGTSVTDIFRAIFNGIGMEFSTIIEEAKSLDISTKKLIFSGGGVHIEPLIKVISSILDMECFYAAEAEMSAFGAALLAADSIDPENGITARTKHIDSSDISPLDRDYRNRWRKYRQVQIPRL